MEIPRLTVSTTSVAGSDARFPVRRIFCVGQNYADHAKEMGSDPKRNPPFFFSKPADAIVASGSFLEFPSRTSDLHHEVELVVALGVGGRDVAVERASECIFGWAVGIDLTRRDLQAEAKKLGRPWDMAKGFDQSAPVGSLVEGPPPDSAVIELRVGEQVRQRGDLCHMIWSVAEIIAALSGYVRLMAGDLIFTGTPAGVGPIRRGDFVTGTIVGAEPVKISF